VVPKPELLKPICVALEIELGSSIAQFCRSFASCVQVVPGLIRGIRALPGSGLPQSDHSPVLACLPMPIRTPRPQSSRAWVVKLQILAAVFVPMLALSLWLRSQGFW
jgi:hypothetical protein